MSTETELRDWRYGHTIAERMCAAVMAIEGFTDIDPQAPLGGADGKKDILARRDGRVWLGAVFFPPTPQSFAEVRAKFESDLEGVEANGAVAFAFFVNQSLTLQQRKELSELSETEMEIYHLERLRAVLDAPIGYGLRVAYLKIAMTAEEQASWTLAYQAEMKAQLDASQAALAEVQERVEDVLERTMLLLDSAPTAPSSIRVPMAAFAAAEAPLAHLTVDMLLFVHRLVVPGSLLPPSVTSALRAVPVAVGPPEEASFVPPGPSEVPELVLEFVQWWREQYPALVDAEDDAVIDALAEFHHRFVSIHPFVDGNGRVARALLDQAARELLLQAVGPQLTDDPQAYFAALREADGGSLDGLRGLIRSSLD